jgi:wyosine [tRNA(Phe)-imidazoG37] synthetase (radical SAM superfamily)
VKTNEFRIIENGKSYMNKDKRDALEANLTDIFSKEEDQGSHVGKRLLKMIKDSQRDPTPPFPRQIQIETTNICNHKCEFCAYTLMKRPKGVIREDLFERLVREAFDCGSREIGLFAGAEPLTCKSLESHIKMCKEIGYEYIYISTNGALGGPDLFRRLLDAGLHSIKFSVNGGDRATYEQVHGKDNYDRVLKNIRFVSEYRHSVTQSVFLGVSFVGMPHTNDSFEKLKKEIKDDVDEIIFYEASNQSGQMPHFPDPPYRDCHLPFNKAHISKEGFLKVCCNDYENLLAVEDLNQMTMMDAWHSDRFQKIRRDHIEDKLDGSVCGNCIRASKTPPKALNDDLINHVIFWAKPIKQTGPSRD